MLFFTIIVLLARLITLFAVWGKISSSIQTVQVLSNEY